MTVTGEFLSRISNDSKRFLNGYHRITSVERQLIYELTSDYLQHFSLVLKAKTSVLFSPLLYEEDASWPYQVSSSARHNGNCQGYHSKSTWLVSVLKFITTVKTTE